MPDTPITQMPATILWVEDETAMREILADELHDAGYTVVTASHGEEALRKLAQGRPDLILCDVAMPVMDGYALLRQVRNSLPHLADVPFVFLSAQDGSGEISRGKYAGADDYLVKPVNFDLMLATIAARIRQVRRMRLQRTRSSSTPAPAIGPALGEAPAFQRLARMFNLITAGIVVLDTQGRVQFANMAAQRLLLECAEPNALGLFEAGVQHSPQTPPTLIRAAIAAGIQGKEYTEFLSLPRRNAQRDLLVTVCSLDCRQGDAEASAAALFISAGDRDKPAPVKALESLFRLTPTEARVAWAFAQGLRPEQIAETFDISLTTVAFHKRNIFQKTHTNRQADLIALLLTLPACVDTE